MEKARKAKLERKERQPYTLKPKTAAGVRKMMAMKVGWGSTPEAEQRDVLADGGDGGGERAGVDLQV